MPRNGFYSDYKRLKPAKTYALTAPPPSFYSDYKRLKQKRAEKKGGESHCFYSDYKRLKHLESLRRLKRGVKVSIVTMRD